MIQDKELMFSDAQAKATGVFDSTAAFDSTNVVDLGAAGDARGQELYLVIGVDTAVQSAGSATVDFSLQTSADNSSYSTLFSTGDIAKAALVAGANVAKVKLPLGVKRYLKVVYTVGTAALTAGKFDAFLTPQVDTAPAGLA